MGYFWRPYVSVQERRGKAERAMAQMRKKGVRIQPVHIEGRKIAGTFWGQAWCGHLEKLRDFENRLPRGRTYVRNGSVCHLEIRKGEVEARVQGSSLYTVRLDIKPLARAAWESIKGRCTGHIASLLDLLQGRLSAGVMSVVTDPQTGMFPKPKEIRMECSCPDWAVMCKHVAAVMYGIGARLDEQPELLFLLRGVDHGELIFSKAEAAVGAAVKGGKARRLAEGDVEGVFGIEIVPAEGRAPRKSSRAAPEQEAAAPPLAAGTLPEVVTGADVRSLRERLGLDPAEFGRRFGVSGTAVVLWEKSTAPLRLYSRSRRALETAWKEAAQPPSGKKGRRARSKPRRGDG